MTSQSPFAQLAAQMGAIGLSTCLLPINIGQHVLVVASRPYREAFVIARATRFKDYGTDYVKVQYRSGFLLNPKEEWLSISDVVPIEKENVE